jgi:hypothetical protein
VLGWYSRARRPFGAPSKAVNPSLPQYQTPQDLTPAQPGLVQIMRQHRFGRIENLRVERGQPILRPDTKIVRVARINGSGEIPEVSIQGELELKPAVLDLLGQLEKLSSAMVLRLEFRHGLPCLLETEAEVGATGL